MGEDDWSPRQRRARTHDGLPGTADIRSNVRGSRETVTNRQDSARAAGNRITRPRWSIELCVWSWSRRRIGIRKGCRMSTAIRRVLPKRRPTSQNRPRAVFSGQNLQFRTVNSANGTPLWPRRPTGVERVGLCEDRLAVPRAIAEAVVRRHAVMRLRLCHCSAVFGGAVARHSRYRVYSSSCSFPASISKPSSMVLPSTSMKYLPTGTTIRSPYFLHSWATRIEPRPRW